LIEKKKRLVAAPAEVEVGRGEGGRRGARTARGGAAEARREQKEPEGRGKSVTGGKENKN
jgi:hypothetical protein